MRPAPSGGGLESPRAAIKLRVEEHAQPLTVLVPRQEMTRADRLSAAQYESGDIVRYTRGSQAVGTAAWVTAWVTTACSSHPSLLPCAHEQMRQQKR